MTQDALFGNAHRGGTVHAIRIDLPGADVEFHPDFLPQAEADEFLADLDETVIWSQESVRMYGKHLPIPRLTAWYGDAGRSYTYSKIAMTPLPWTTPLTGLRELLESTTGASFNSVLLNLYRRGSDSVAWHSDDEPELGPAPIIASISLGATRKFQFRSKSDPHLREEVALTHGSMLLMRGETQQNWVHQVPKTARDVPPRINLTFRHIY